MKEEGCIIATVPNMHSLHRGIGVKAGFLKNIYSSTEWNIRFNQFGRFTEETLEKVFQQYGFKIHESFGYMLESFSSRQMQSLNLSMNIYCALF
jgi:hypothetical protein